MTFPTSALAAAETAFTFLTCEPAPLVFDARAIAGLPDRMIALDELRGLLVAGRLGADTADAVWRQLACHTRDWGPAWVVGAVGVALPGLTRMAARISRHYRHLVDDIDSEILTGFLTGLRTANVETPRLWLRLYWGAWKSGVTVLRSGDTSELPPEGDTGSRCPLRPYGHPDLILGRAVAAGVLTPAQADLIGATRLGGVLVEEIAATHGVSAPVARMRRHRAEVKLVQALHAGDLALPVGRCTATATA